MQKILLLDDNHALIEEQLSKKFLLEKDFQSSYSEIIKKIEPYTGIVIRSRIPIDTVFLEHAKNLKFIARVGAGMENINVEQARKRGIFLINSPEGNCDAVAEHTLGMLLVLMHRLFHSFQEVKQGIWLREENRGDELIGKTFGIIGYGNMGKALAKKLSGFDVNVIFYDLLPNLSDEYARQVSLEELQSSSDILSLHIPLNDTTHYMIDDVFIQKMNKSFYLINTSRGKNVNTKAIIAALKSKKIKGVCLDVLEYEKSSFENLEIKNEELQYLLSSEKAIITPHIAGWTKQSKRKLAQFVVNKILNLNL